MDVLADRSKFFEELGRTISRWALVEWSLCHIFCHSLGLTLESYSAPAAFFAVINFRSKLDMVHAALRIQIADAEMLAEWTTLHKRLMTLSKARNKLAHGMVLLPVGGKPVLAGHIGDPHTHPKSSKSSIFSGLSTKDFSKLQSEFSSLQTDLDAFRTKIQPPPSQSV